MAVVRPFQALRYNVDRYPDLAPVLAALPRARRIYLTEVDASPPGDVLFPAFDEAQWTEVSREAHPAGEGDDHAFVFRVLERK